MIHELVHTELFRKTYQSTPDGTDITNALQKLGTPHHEVMTDYYFTYMQDILKAIDLSWDYNNWLSHYNGNLSSVNELYNALTWVGLQSTPAYSMLTSDQKRLYQDYRDNVRNMGKKNCE